MYRSLVHLACIAAILLFVVGCSEDHSNPLSTTGASTGAEFVYPELTAEMLAGSPIPGYRIVQFGASALDSDLPCDSLWDAERVRPDQEGDLNIGGAIELEINDGVNPDNVTIRMVAPVACYGVVDFYPHPYQFNGNVTVRWELSELSIPPEDWASLVPLYWNDVTGEYELMEHEWLDGGTLLMYTNHFSRYIIAAPIW